MQKKVTLSDIARESGTSVSTVSRVINKNDLKCASDVTIKKIFKAIQELGYSRNDNEQKSEKSNNAVGVILGSGKEDKYNHSFYSQIYKGLEEKLIQRGFYIDFYYTTEEINQNNGVIESIMDSAANSLVVIEELGQNAVDEIKRRYDNVINIGMNNLDTIKNDFICVDTYKTTKTMLEKFIKKGLTKIVLMGGGHADYILSTKPYADLIDERFIAYRDAILINGIELNKDLIYDAEWDPHKAYEIMNDIIKRKVTFDAVFAADDMMAVACLKALLDNGIKVPQDCMIVGFDDLPISTFSNPQISTIHIPRYEMGSVAADMLYIKQNNMLGTPVKIVLDCNFEQRETSDI